MRWAWRGLIITINCFTISYIYNPKVLLYIVKLKVLSPKYLHKSIVFKMLSLKYLHNKSKVFVYFTTSNVLYCSCLYYYLNIAFLCNLLYISTLND